MITAGTIDTSFVIGSGFINDLSDCLIYTTKLQSDGKILVGGNFTSYDGNTAYHLIRLNSDGSVDNTFDYGPYLTHQGTGNPAYVKAIEIESDGKILVGGYFDTYNGNSTGYIIRLNVDGSVSDFFNSGFDGIVRAIKVQSDGKILVGGGFEDYDGNVLGRIARLNTDGSLDTTFGVGVGNEVDDQVFSIEIESTGNILIGGDFDTYNGTDSRKIVRLDQTGTIVDTFGFGFNNRVQKIVLQPDGKILCGGQFDWFNGTNSYYMIRLNTDGTIDTTFQFDNYVIDMCVQSDGRIIAGGQFEEFNSPGIGWFYSPYIVRLNPSGSIDASFLTTYLESAFNQQVNSIMLESNGNILVGGWFTDYIGEEYNRLISLNNDVSTYVYQYVYDVNICSNLQDITYYIGSDVELNVDDYITISNINNPSFIKCGRVGSFNLAETPTYEYVTTNVDCDTCLSGNSQIAFVVSCVDPEVGGPIIVSNQYQIGDILYIDETITGEGTFTIRGCFTILDLLPYDNEFGLYNNIIDYQPQESCEKCITCNGQYYVVSDCSGEDPSFTILSFQDLNYGNVIYYPSGTSNCKEVVEILSTGPTEFFDNPQIINSTLIYTGCTDCNNDLLSTSWQTDINGDGFVDFISDPWELRSSDDSEGDGWSYIKRRFNTSGSITLLYYYQTSDECCEWPFYFVSPNEPIGDNNIDFSEDGSGNIFGTDYLNNPPQSITINYNAGDWVSIGVYSDDSVEGPGSLFLNPIQLSPNYNTYEFTTCDGELGFVTLPSDTINTPSANITEITYSALTSEGLDEMPLPEDEDDDYIEIPFPNGFNTKFLCSEYTSAFMGTNAYLTFGNGSTNCCFEIPNEIPTEVGLPGVYMSIGTCENDGCTDGYVNNWYSGLTDGGNKFVIRYEGSYYSEAEPGSCTIPLVFNYIFYSGVTSYFDLVIENNTIFCNNNSTGGVSNGVDGSFLSTFNSSSEKSYRITNVCPIIKGNVGNTPAVCGTLGGTVSGITTPTLGGSVYFDSFNDSYSTIQIDNSSGDFGFDGGNDLTIEWFQYWEGCCGSTRPFSIGSYGGGTVFLQISFEGNGLLWIGDGAGSSTNYSLGINLGDITNTWVHFAITRNFNGSNRVWRVFVNGVMVLEQVDNTLATTNLPLIIGNQPTDDGQFQGYITNFRVNNLSALYVSDFQVPTEPLENIPNTILLLLATDSSSYLTDTSGQQTGNITTTGLLSWSSLSPFTSKYAGLFYSDGTTTYDNCSGCTGETRYSLTLKNCLTNEISYVSVLLSDLNKILSNGRFITNKLADCFEVLDYCIVPTTLFFSDVKSFTTCELCLAPRSANTETMVCVIDCSGNTVTISPPHPIYTDGYGKAVSQLNMITLGGPNGLNS